MDLDINFGNGFQVYLFEENNHIHMAICNNNGYIITDRKLTDEERDKLMFLILSSIDNDKE